MARQKTIGQTYTIEREKRPSQKKELNKFQLSFLKAIERLEDPPKPTKWVKPLKEMFKPIEEQKDSSAARLAFTLNPMLRMNIANQTGKDIVQLLKSKDEKDYISGLDEIRTGVESGAHNVGASLGSLLFMGTDLVANTDFLEKFEKLMKKSRPEQPETWRGELISLMTSFGVPGSLVTKIMARAGKVGQIAKVVNKFNNHKASKIAMRIGNWATVGGATDFLVNYEGRPTLFVKPEDTSQLKGRKKAAAEFRNRVKFGFEGSVLGGLMPLTGKGLQLGYKYGLRPVGEPLIGFGAKAINNLTFRPISYVLSKDKTVLPKVAQLVRDTGKFTTMKMLAPLYASRGQFGKGYFQLPPFEQWSLGDVNRRGLTQQRLKKLDNFLSWFRAYGKAPKDIENVTEVVSLFIKSKARKINRIYEGLEKNAYKLAKEFERRHNTNRTSSVGEKYFLDEVEMFLRGQRKLTDLPKKMQGLSLDLEKNIKSIMGELKKALPKGKDADEVVKALGNILTKDIKNYMVKSFKTFTTPNYTPPKELVENAADWLAKNVIRNNKDHRKAALEYNGE